MVRIMDFEKFKLNISEKNLILLNIIGLIVGLSINILSNALPLNNRTAGEISDSLYNYFAPAGYVFAIWFFIYIGWFLLIYFTGFTLDGKEYLDKANIWLSLNLILNGSWLIFWHYGEYLLSVIFMIGIFLSLLLLYERLEIGEKSFTQKEMLFLQFPISLYFGWITVATIANITAYLVSLGITFDSLDSYITVLLLLIGTFITFLIIYRKKDYFFAIVPVWAFFGIYVKQSSGLPIHSAVVSLTALVCAVIILAMIIYSIIKTRK
jgi:hypothetical protein